jgi:hypothetical protein
VSLVIIAFALLLAASFELARSAHASEQTEIHYSPEERLHAIDAELIGSAKSSIDVAA